MTGKRLSPTVHPAGSRLSGLWWGFLLGLIQLAVLWGTSVPLGVPLEWTWTRNAFTILDWGGLWPAVLAGIILILIVRYGAARMEAASRRQRAFWLLILWAAGTFWTLSLVGSLPGITGLARVPFVLFYTRSSGYFTQAREEAMDLNHFLSTYRERIEDSSLPENYLHMGTHPPGLTTAFVAIIRLCDNSAGIRKLILATQPASVRESFAVMKSLASGQNAPITQTDQAAIWLTALIVVTLAAGTCFPLYLLARRTVGSQAAWWAASFWLLVPAVGVFFPKSDVLFPCLAMWIQWFWLQGVDRRSLRFGAAAGASIFVAVCLTLAFAPLGLILLLQGAFVASGPDIPVDEPETRNRIRDRLRVYIGSGVTFGLLIIIAGLAGHLNLVEIWLQNLKNHASFYLHATRTYLPWLLENPIELGFSLGLPLAFLSICGLYGVFTGVGIKDRSVILRQRLKLHADILIPVCIWMVLWLSGKNMGEAARLWVFLMPYAVWLAAVRLQQASESSARLDWTPFFVAQMIVCLGTVLSIDGFGFMELMQPAP